MKKAIIIQARMTSTRLPGKVLKPVLGKPLLLYQLERLKRVKLQDEIIVATTTNREDEPIVEFCDKQLIPYFRGSEEDVLSRYFEAAKEYGVDVIVRITSDCPLIDPQVIDEIITYYSHPQKKNDYVSNTLQRTYPRGMDTEVFSFEVLKEVHKIATELPDREHVTPFIYRHPQIFRVANVTYHEDQSKHRWTVDTPEDFELIKRILENLYPQKPTFLLQDCLTVIKENPDWQELNAHINQKEYR